MTCKNIMHSSKTKTIFTVNAWLTVIMWSGTMILSGCNGGGVVGAGDGQTPAIVNTAQVRREHRRQSRYLGLSISKAFPVRGEIITITVAAERAKPGDNVVIYGKNLERVRLRLDANLKVEWTATEFGPVTAQIEGSDDPDDRRPIWVVSHPLNMYFHKDFWPEPKDGDAALAAIRGLRAVSVIGNRSEQALAYWHSRGARVLCGAPHKKSEHVHEQAAAWTSQRLRANGLDGFHMDETYMTDAIPENKAGFLAVLNTRAIYGADYYIGLYCAGTTSRYSKDKRDPVTCQWAMRNADGVILDECYGGTSDLQYARYLEHIRLPRSKSGLMTLCPGRERGDEERDLARKVNGRIYSGMSDMSASIFAEVAMIRRNQPALHNFGAWNVISAQDTIAFDKAMESWFLHPAIHLHPRDGKLEALNIGQDYADGVILQIHGEDGATLSTVPLRRLAPGVGQLVDLPSGAHRVTLQVPEGMQDLYAERTNESIRDLYRYTPAGYVIPDELNPLQVTNCSIDEHAVFSLPAGAPLEIVITFNRPLSKAMFDAQGRFSQEEAVQMVGVESGALRPDSMEYDAASRTLRLRYNNPARDYYSLALVATDQKRTYGFRDENGLPIDGDGDGDVRRGKPRRPGPRGLGGDYTRHFIVNGTERLSAVTWTAQDLGGGHVLQSGQAAGLLEFRQHQREHPLQLEKGTSVSLLGNFSGDGIAELVLLDPERVEVCRFRATADKRRCLFNGLPVKVLGVYTLQVRLQEQNPILYDVDLLVGGVHELEPQGLAFNDLAAAAESLRVGRRQRTSIVSGTIGDMLHDGYQLADNYDEVDNYTLPVSAKEKISMNVKFLSGFGVAELRDTEGRVVASSDTASATSAPICWTATANGTCSVRIKYFDRVNPLRLQTPASYVLGVSRDTNFAPFADSLAYGLVWGGAGDGAERLELVPASVTAMLPNGTIQLDGKTQSLMVKGSAEKPVGLNTVMNGTASLALWCKTETAGRWEKRGDRTMLRGPTLSGGRYANGPYFVWGQLDDEGRLRMMLRNNEREEGELVGKTSINDGAWHHVVLSRNAADGTLRIIVDGREDAKCVAPRGVLANYLRYYSIGTSDGEGHPVAADRWPGELKNIRVYERELTMNEVRSLSDTLRSVPGNRYGGMNGE